MYCYNCGAQLPEGSAFCSECGAKQPIVPSAPANVPENPPAPAVETVPPQEVTPAKPVRKKKSHKGLVVGIICLLLVAAIGVGCWLWFTGARRKAVDAVKLEIKIYTAHVTADEYCSLYPPEYLDKSAQESGLTLEEAKAALQEELDDSYEYWQNQSVKYELYSCDVTSEESYSAEQLQHLRDKAGFNIDEAKIITMKIHGMFAGEEKTLEDVKIHVLRRGLKWYVSPYGNIAQETQYETPYEYEDEDWD